MTGQGFECWRVRRPVKQPLRSSGAERTVYEWLQGWEPGTFPIVPIWTSHRSRAWLFGTFGEAVTQRESLKGIGLRGVAIMRARTRRVT